VVGWGYSHFSTGMFILMRILGGEVGKREMANPFGIDYATISRLSEIH
jgi:hypothetical protein